MLLLRRSICNLKQNIYSVARCLIPKLLVWYAHLFNPLFLLDWLKSPTYLIQGRRHRRVPGGHGLPPPFFRSKKKIRKKGKKERVSKQKLLKGYHQSQNVTVLAILERLEFKNFSCRPTMVADILFQCSMAPPLWNPFCRPSNQVAALAFTVPT